MQVEMHYGLMAATFPTLKAFVGAFNTGWGTYDSAGASGYGSQSQSKAHVHPSGPSNIVSKVVSGGQAGMGSQRPRHAGRSRVSEDSDDSQKMIIRQTRTTDVAFEDVSKSCSSKIIPG